LVRFLLIDDEPADRALVLRELQRTLGAPEVDAREIGEAPALEAALAGPPPEIVITDYRLRWSDGLDVLRRVKARWPSCRVVMFTDSGNEEVVVEAMKAGLDDYVLKSPRQFAPLVARVDALLTADRVRRDADAVHQRLGELLNRLAVGVFRADGGGRLLEANPAYLKIFGAADFSALAGGRILSHAVDDKEADKLRARFEERGYLQNEEYSGRRLDGEVIDLEVTVTRSRGSDGVGMIDGLLEDVTERKRSRALLLESHERSSQNQRIEAMGRLAGGIAHDFNNLLTTIGIYADLTLTAIGKDHPGRANLNQIQRTGDRAAELVSQLLAFARRQIMHPRAIDLNAVIRDLESMLGRVIGEDVEIQLALAPDLAPTLADPSQLEQVIMNLVLNARDAMPGGGELRIETANIVLDAARARRLPGLRPGAYVVLRVSDTGDGMSPQVLAHLFEPFFTTKDVGQGTGLGLSMVHGIVRQSDGAVAVQSHLGRGSSFEIYLPQTEGPLEPLAPSAPQPAPRGGSETILLVEDEVTVRAVVASLLRDQGYRVLEADRGEEAARQAGEIEGPLHLLLTDVVMPGLDVRTLVERVRDRHPDVRVLFTSGYTEDVMLLRGVHQGDTSFLSKPFSSAELLRSVRQSLDA
jgi:PAS domain S-box-containing protein